MAFSDELKNDVIDIDSYNTEVKEGIDKLRDKYIKENDTFIDEYYKSSLPDSKIDISSVPYEQKIATAKKEFAKYDYDAGTDISGDFEKRYEQYLKDQEQNQERRISKALEILKYTQDEFAAKINTFDEKLDKAKEKLAKQDNEIKEKENQIINEKAEVAIIKEEIKKLEEELEKLNDQITILYDKKQELEGKDNLTDKEKEELDKINKELSPLTKEYEDKEKIKDDKEVVIKEKEAKISEYEKEKSDLETKRAENQKIYDEAIETLSKSKEAYTKNGEEIKKVAEENNIDYEGILNPKASEEKEKAQEKQEEKGKDTPKEAKTSGGNTVAAPTAGPISQEEIKSNMPTNYSPNVMDDFAKCSNSKERMDMYINNPAGFEALANSIQNRGITDFWKNHRVKRAIENNNKELLKNMKDPSDYVDLINNALGSDGFGKNEQSLFEKLFDKKSKENILNGFSKYSNEEIESLYNVVNKLNSKDFKDNPELAKKIDSQIMPYIKSGVLVDYSKRKPLGRFNSKHEMTGKNQYINYISSETTKYSAKCMEENIQSGKTNVFSDGLKKGINPPTPTPPVPTPTPTKVPTKAPTR